MTDNDPTHSTESLPPDRETARSHGSRRGFLRKTAATGILGMTGMALATESARAGEADEDNRSSHGDSFTVKGDKDGSSFNGDRTYYDIRTTGDIDHMGAADGGDYNDEPPHDSHDGVYGLVEGGGVDEFAFNGQLARVYFDGVGRIDVDFARVSD